MLSSGSIVLVLSWLSIISATPTTVLETRKSSSDPKISVSKFTMDCSGFADILTCTSQYTMKVSYDPGKNADSSKGAKFDGVTCAGYAIGSHAGVYTDCDSTSNGMQVSAKVTSVNKVEIKIACDAGEADGLYKSDDSDKTADGKSFSMQPTFSS
jgi:hypothetical protein